MVTHATVQEIILGYHLMLIPSEIMMVEGNRVASVILITFTAPMPTMSIFTSRSMMT